MDAAAAVEALYRSEWGRIVASLIRTTGDFDRAEDATQEAFAAATMRWPIDGVPEFPRAWIMQTARHKAIDRLRREARLTGTLNELPAGAEAIHPDYDGAPIEDDRLRLIFTCCHPALPIDAQVALTLRTLCGLQTEEIARAFLVPTATMAQRIVRAKRRILGERIPYAVPEPSEIPERLHAVLAVIYLVFNEGYAATSGESLLRASVCAEAIRLARLLRDLMQPPPAEVIALLALMLLHDARRETRIDERGDLVLLDEQDRSRWNQVQIAEALPLVEQAMRGGPGLYALQAAIAALHCEAASAEETDWPQIAALYEWLSRLQPSRVIALNHAVAVAMAEGPARGLELIEQLPGLHGYHLWHAARADLLRRSGDSSAAAHSYERAIELASNDAERRFLERRLHQVRQDPSQA